MRVHDACVLCMCACMYARMWCMCTSSCVYCMHVFTSVCACARSRVHMYVPVHVLSARVYII